MIKIENVDVFNFEGALRGLRNPYMSHSKSDSFKCKDDVDCNSECRFYDEHDCTCPEPPMYDYIIGKADMELCKKLIKGGSPHRKFLRQIFISMDITGPWYWWKQFEQYKIGTTTNSESSIHAINKRGFTLNDFSCDKLIAPAVKSLERLIADINELRTMYVNYDEFVKSCTCNSDMIPPCKKDLWYSIIQLLPSSFNQTRTVTMSYENALNIIQWRRNHKLDEWREFCGILINELPYMKEFISEEVNTK